MEIDDSFGRENNSWEKNGGKRYIEKTEGRKPKPYLVRLIEKLEPGNAIELGIGAGNETKFLLENGWKVLAVDINEESKTHLMNILNEEQAKRLVFNKEKFERLSLEKNSCDLVVAFDSLHFCNKNDFYNFFQKVSAAIKPKGYFVGNLLGKNDSWKESREDFMPFFTKEEIIKLFSDFEFDEKGLLEFERDGVTTSGKPKHWHTFFIRAKKK